MSSAGDDGRSTWSYLPALDGVRALAVVAVVLFHYWPDVVPGGFIGVDVFFVMSGFLITGILQAEHARVGRIDLGAFWGRRVRRLVPAVVVLVVVTAIAAAVTDTGSARQFADSVGALTWTTNLVEAVFGGSRVWLHNSRTVLDHLWSLAIEEQFYLLWPLIGWLLFRRVRSVAARVAVVLVGIAASAAAMGVVGGVMAYFRTDTRAFELLIGAALALSGLAVGPSATRRQALVHGAAVVGLAGLVAFAALAEPGDDWMYPWGFLLVCLAAASLVFASAQAPRWLSAVLEWPPVRHLGQVSYGVYLWHIPVLRILSTRRLGFDGPALQVLRFVVLAVLVEVSYRFVEEPFRRGRIPLRPALVVAGYAVAAVALIPLMMDTRDDLAGQWDAIDRPPAVRPGQQRVLVTGDLVGAAIANGLRRDDAYAVWSLADPGCPGDTSTPLLDDGRQYEIDEFCRHWSDRWTRGIARFRPAVVLIGAGYWDTLEPARPETPERRARRYRALLERQVRIVEAGDSATRAAIVRIDDWSSLIDPRQRPRADRLAAIAAYDDAVAAVAAAHPRVEVVEVSGRDGWKDLSDLGPALSR
ncbi:MAG: acyltransferase [Acidimicrobiales bacterium]